MNVWFPPFDGLHIYGKELDNCPYPPGLPLKDVVWNVDREVFWPSLSYRWGSIRSRKSTMWLMNYRKSGWRPGSYTDFYEKRQEELEAGNLDEEEVAGVRLDDPTETYAHLEKVSLRRRPKEFTRLVKAIVRMLAEVFDDQAAYAIDRSGMTFQPDVPETSNHRGISEMHPRIPRFRQASYLGSREVEYEGSSLAEHP